MSDKKQIELTRQTFIEGKFKKVGEKVTIPHLEANYLVNSGYAKEVEAKKAPAKKAADKKGE